MTMKKMGLAGYGVRGQSGRRFTSVAERPEEERRAHLRVPVELPIELDLAGHDGPHARGYTVDVSEGGLRVRLDSPLPSNARGLVTVAAPDQSLVLGGVVLEAPTAADTDGGFRRMRLVRLTTSNESRLRRLLSDPLELFWTGEWSEETPAI
jgi:hypothetical protein